MTKRKKSGADEEVASAPVGPDSSTAERMELQSNTCGVVHPKLGWPCQLSSGHSGSHWAAPNFGQAGFATYWTDVLGRLVSTSERGEGEAASLEEVNQVLQDMSRIEPVAAVATQEVSREAQGGAVTFPEEVLRLSACDVMALSNTEASFAANAVEASSAAWSPAYESVRAAVRREMDLRAEVERLQAEVARLQKRVAGFRARRRR